MSDLVYYTMDELASLLRCGREKLYRMARAKELPCVKLGQWLFPVKDIEVWMEKRTIKVSD